jgi:hypothetical protein
MREHFILIATLAIVFAGGLTWKAEAAAWTSAARMKAVWRKIIRRSRKPKLRATLALRGSPGVVATVSVSAAHTANVNLPATGVKRLQTLACRL